MSSQDPKLTDQSTGDRNPASLIGGLVVVVGAFLLLVFGGTLFGSSGGEESAVVAEQPLQPGVVQLPVSGDPLQVGRRPYEFALQDLNGNLVALNQFIGRPLIVNFWATWCGPCRIEMPELQAVFEEYREEKGLVILALDQDETAPEVADYFAELGLTFEALLDDDSDTAKNYGIHGTLPATVFINPEGEVTVVHRGVMTRGQIETFLAETIPGKSPAG